MDADLAHQGIGTLIQTWQTFRMYAPDHPVTDRRIEDCFQKLQRLLRQRSPLRLGLLEETLFVEEHLFTEAHGVTEEAVKILKSLRIDGLELIAGLTRDEVATFFRLATPLNLVGDILEETLTLKGVHHIRVVQLMEEVQKPRAIYDRALKVVDRIFQDIQGGRIPSTDEARGVSKEMVQSILQEPHALFALSQIKDYDHYTFTHSVNVGIVALTVGRACDLPPQQLQLLAFGGMVHDIGKLKVPIEIITKPGRLNDSEFRQISRHPETGVELISQDPSVPSEVVDIIHYHHLHFNRDGYPQYLGQEISPLVDMVTIADHYDAMTTHRSYQQPIPPREAIRKMRTLSGSHLHPQFLASFIGYLGEYPVGTLLRLDNSEVALVVGFGTGDSSRLRLRRLFDPAGRPVMSDFFTELPPSDWGRIIAEINPANRGIDVSSYFQ